MDVGSILIGSVIDFIFLKDFIESVIKKNICKWQCVEYFFFQRQ